MRSFAIATDLSPVRDVPGYPIYEIVYGSHAHGTATPTSDVDRRGVFLLPSDDFLGLGFPKTTWERKADDIVFWELGHFCRLLLKGNPNIVGMLYAPEDCRITEHAIGDQLIGLRSLFLSSALQSAYMGWITRELHDIGKLHKGHAKRLSHVPRLMWELESALEGHLVVRPSDERIATIVAIKTGTMDYDEAVRLCGSMLLDIERKNGQVRLPAPPSDAINSWLLLTREMYGR